VVDCIAELTGQICLSLFPDQGLQLLPSHTDQGPGNTVPGAVAAVLDGVALQKLQLELRQDRLEQPAGVHPLLQNRRDRPHALDPGLNLADDLLPRAGQQLDQIASRGGDRLVHPHQHP